MSTRTERQQDNKLNEKHTQILKQLMQRADNKRCVDCRKKDPRWCSWNLGVFMCIRCSGIHRSIGTHITKVKSADLDTWTPEQIENMVRWGNGKANFYWEHELPKNMEIPENNIEQWIRAKYERKQYAMKGAIPDPGTIPLPDGVGAVNIPSAGGASHSNSSVPRAAPQVVQQSPAPAQQHQQQASAPSKQNSIHDDLFDAFQSAPAPAPSADVKTNILSLFNSPLPQVGGIERAPAVATGNFASFNPAPANSFSAFNSSTSAAAATAPPSAGMSFAAFNGMAAPSMNNTIQAGGAVGGFGAFQSLSSAPPSAGMSNFSTFSSGGTSTGLTMGGMSGMSGGLMSSNNNNGMSSAPSTMNTGFSAFQPLQPQTTSSSLFSSGAATSTGQTMNGMSGFGGIGSGNNLSSAGVQASPVKPAPLQSSGSVGGIPDFMTGFKSSSPSTAQPLSNVSTATTTTAATTTTTVNNNSQLDLWGDFQ